MTEVKGNTSNEAKPPQPALPPGVPVMFADSVLSINIVNGVARIVFGSVDPNNAMTPTGQLMLPVAQFAALSRVLATAVNGLAEKVRQAQSAATESELKN